MSENGFDGLLAYLPTFWLNWILFLVAGSCGNCAVKLLLIGGLVKLLVGRTGVGAGLVEWIG